jgi:hypothetical protein
MPGENLMGKSGAETALPLLNKGQKTSFDDQLAGNYTLSFH